MSESFFNEHGYHRDMESQLRAIGAGREGSTATLAANQINHLKSALTELQAKVAELEKGSYETDERSPMNMCDGCVIGLPIVNGLHRKADGAPVMACSAALYRNPLNSIAAQQLRKGEGDE